MKDTAGSGTDIYCLPSGSWRYDDVFVLLWQYFWILVGISCRKWICSQRGQWQSLHLHWEFDCHDISSNQTEDISILQHLSSPHCQQSCQDQGRALHVCALSLQICMYKYQNFWKVLKKFTYRVTEILHGRSRTCNTFHWSCSSQWFWWSSWPGSDSSS